MRHCPQWSECPYAQIFQPTNPQNPSGLVNTPRPFLFRTRHLDGKTLHAGDEFYVDIHLFTQIHNISSHFRAVFSQFENTGFGFFRHRAVLTSMEEQPEPRLSLDFVQSGVTSLEVQFRSPTELKYRGTLVHEPHFPALWNNTSGRLSALTTFYGRQPLAMDFAPLCKLAQHVRLTHCELHHVKKERRSSRTGQVHPLGGLIGSARYEGDLDPFLPYLRAAQWTGVGRHTVWGKGEIALFVPSTVSTISPAPQQTASS